MTKCFPPCQRKLRDTSYTFPLYARKAGALASPLQRASSSLVNRRIPFAPENDEADRGSGGRLVCSSSPPFPGPCLPYELTYEGGSFPSPHEVTGRSLAQEFREPGFVLDFLVQNGQRQIVRPAILASGQIADVGVPPHGATLRLHKHLKHRLDILWIFGKTGGRTSRDVMERLHIFRQLAAEFVDPRNQSLEVIAILDPCRLRDLLDSLPFQTDQVRPQDRVVVECGEFGSGILDKQFHQLIHVDSRLFHHLSCNLRHVRSPFLSRGYDASCLLITDTS